MNRFIIIDGHALIYRSFYAFPELTDPQGRLVNAVYGFTRIMLTAIRDFEPEYIAVAFDHKAPTKRSETFEAYKAQRAPMPEELKGQIQIVKDVVTALNIPQFELAGFEADDLIGTIALQLQESGQLHDDDTERGDGLQMMIITGDKDLLQLVNDHVRVFIPGRGKFSRDKEYDAAGVQEKMGVMPAQVVDLKALMGDTSDNIPGVKGIGPKTAVQLISDFGSLDGVYKRVESKADQASDAPAGEGTPVIKSSVLEKLKQDKTNAYLSQQLATIEQTAPISFDLAACSVMEYDKDKVAKVFEDLNFDSLVQLLPKDSFEQGVQEALF